MNPRFRRGNPSPEGARWTPPPDDVLKLNTDVACPSSSSESGLGISIRKKDGSIVAASSIFLDFSLESHMAELRAIIEGMKLVQALGGKKIIVELNSQMAVNFINKRSVVWNDVDAIVEDIWCWMSFFYEIEFRYIP